MITSFELFEKMNLSDIKITGNLPPLIIDILVHGFSLLLSKKKKRNLRLISVNSEQKKEINTTGSEKTIKIEIKLSNHDMIESIWVEIEKKMEKESSLTIKINDEIFYDLPGIKMNLEKVIQKIIDEYHKYLEGKNWKIK